MLAVKKASDLLVSFDLPEIDKVYSFNLPQEAMTNTSNTVALITDTNTSLDYGNNDFYSKTNEIELQIFFKLELDFDPEDLENRLLHKFIENGYTVADIASKFLDIDTRQITATYYLDDRTNL